MGVQDFDKISLDVVGCSSLILTIAVIAIGAYAWAQNTSREEQNKKTVLAFYQAAINDKDFATASKYLGDKYIQHNPMAASGPEGLKAFVELAKKSFPEYRTEFKKVFADGNYVIVHCHEKANAQDRGSAVIDIFRLENGKVVEHWDVIQAIPEKASNTNGMF